MYLCTLLALCVLLVAPAHAVLHAHEAQALEDLMTGITSDLPLGWTAGNAANACADFHVIAFSTTLHCEPDGAFETVVTLNLSFKELAGTVPASLSDLVNLRKLDLSHNEFSGTIPASLGALADLSHVDLSHNEFSGTLPTFDGRYEHLNVRAAGAFSTGSAVNTVKLLRPDAVCDFADLGANVDCKHAPQDCFCGDFVPGNNQQRDYDLTILHMGDFHCHMVPRPDGRVDNVSGGMIGGLARLKSQVDEFYNRAHGQRTILLVAGDTTQGAAECTYTGGRAMLDVMAPFPISAFAPGNWDFVYDIDTFEKHFASANPVAPWNAISANAWYNALAGVTDPIIKRPRHLILPPFRVIYVEGVRVGVVGLTTERGPKVVGSSTATSLTFATDGGDETREWTRYLREVEKVDLVVKISELGLANNLRIANQTSAFPSAYATDIVLSSDQHERTRVPISGNVHGTWVTETSQDGTVMGEFRVTLDRSRASATTHSNKVAGIHWEQHPITEALREDPTVKALVDRARAPLLSAAAGGTFPDPEYNYVNPFNGYTLNHPIDDVIGYTGDWLYRSNFASDAVPALAQGGSHDLITDAFRWAAGADFSLLRGFRYGTHIAPGPITYEDMYYYMPVGAQLASGVVKGNHIKIMAARIRPPTVPGIGFVPGATHSDTDWWGGGWYFNPSGLTYDVSPCEDSTYMIGSHIISNRVQDIRVGGVPITGGGNYRYASYYYDEDPTRINRFPGSATGTIQVIKDISGNVVDATEIIAWYLGNTTSMGSPYTHGPPRVNFLERLPNQMRHFNNDIIQPLAGTGGSAPEAQCEPLALPGECLACTYPAPADDFQVCANGSLQGYHCNLDSCAWEYQACASTLLPDALASTLPAIAPMASNCVQPWGYVKQEAHRENCPSIDLCGFTDAELFATHPRNGDSFYIVIHEYLTAQYSRTCGCATPDAADNVMIDAAGEFAEEHCPTSLSISPVIGPQHPDRAEALTHAQNLREYTRGKRSVPHCHCGEVSKRAELDNRDVDGDHDPEVIYEDELFAAQMETIDYKSSLVDIAYVNDDMTDVPTDTLKPIAWWSLVGVGVIAGVAVIAVALALLVRRRKTHAAGYSPMGSGDDGLTDDQAIALVDQV